MKIAIVGPQLSKWKSKEQIEKTKTIIEELLTSFLVTKQNPVLVSGHCPKGGVDIWAEEIAKKLGCCDPKFIFQAEVNKWEDQKVTESSGHTDIYKGYKSRNIQIAEACDVLYCIVPKKIEPLWFPQKEGFCKHCEVFGHTSNGGCWTMKYAKELGKEIHLIVIE